MQENKHNHSNDVNQNDQNLLARLDERVLTLVTDVAAINTKLDHKYVSQDEFQPVKKIVYSAVGLMLASMLIAVIALVIHSAK